MTLTGPAMGPCEPFTTWDEITACGVVPDIDEVAQALVVEVASETIWGLLGERYTGRCERTILPCWDGSCGQAPCCCTWVGRLDLGGLPVWGITAVMIDGVEVDNSAGDMYRLEDWRYLVWLGGVAWPRCQGDWSVELIYGTPIPARARRAASLLGLEMAKQCAGGDCGLDVQTSRYTREGLTVELSNPLDMISRGATGIPTIDMLLGSMGGRGGGGSLLDLSTRHAPRTVTWTILDGES